MTNPRKTKKELRSKFVGREATTDVMAALEAEAEAMGVRKGQCWKHLDYPEDGVFKVEGTCHRVIVHDMHPGAQENNLAERLVGKDAPYARYCERGLSFSIPCATLVSARSRYALVEEAPDVGEEPSGLMGLPNIL